MEIATALSRIAPHAAPRTLSRGNALGTLKVAVVGHVDHGKSTLVGRVLNDTDSLPDGKLEAVTEMCRRRAMPFEWAFVTDAFQAERDQGITIDVSHIRFSTPNRNFVLIDAPGHREFIKNMISGSAGCDAALVVIDAEQGVQEQSRRHGFLLHLLGVRQIAVAVTKMDLVDYDFVRFTEIEREFRHCLAEFGVEVPAIVPVSGRDGDNLLKNSSRMDWYHGPTVVEVLEKFHNAPPENERPLRMPVQDVYRFDSRRIIAGRIESGRIEVGDTILFSPSNHTVKVKSIESWPGEEPVSSANAGQSVGITLDEQVFVERGEILSHEADPPVESTVFRARLFWLGASPLVAGGNYLLKLNTLEAQVTVERIERVIDSATMTSMEAGEVRKDSVADLILRSRTMLAFDPASENPRTGRFVLSENSDIVGGGLIDMEGYPDQRQLITMRSTNVVEVAPGVTPEMHAERTGHRGGVVWLTGLSGAGKSTLALEVERQLFKKGYQIYVLDGDNLRHGLNANLGFSPEDRAENIRRVGEVAALFAEAGFVALSAFISPYRADRDRAREAAKQGFHEIYIKADIETCESRDVKGLYKKARAGEIADFTGISAPYEAPEACELVVDTNTATVAESVARIMDYIDQTFPIQRHR